MLLRRFLCIGLLCLTTLLLLTTYGIYRVFSWRLVESAHAEAQAICHVVLVKEKKQLLSAQPGGATRLTLTADERQHFAERLGKYLEPYAIEALRIWDRQGRLVNGHLNHSEHPPLAKSHPLRQALDGQGISRLEAPSQGLLGPDAVAHEQLVSYLPIWGKNRSVLGAMEIRRNIAGMRRQIRQGVTFSGLLLGAVLLALFGCIYILVKRGTERLAKAQQALRALATTDPLTGLYNRREVLTRAEGTFSRRKASGLQTAENFGILMLDFDDFKSINDTYGHPTGDRVLEELARRIQTALRPYDIVGRFGGEEFLVVLPDSSLKQCQEIAERLCRTVRERPFEVDDVQIFGSVSIGGATAHPLDRDLKALLLRADQGLYQAKNLGKNCTTWVAAPLADNDLAGQWAGC